MSAIVAIPQKKALIPFFILTYAITWGIGALAIFLPAQFQALFGRLSDTSPVYFVAVAAPTISATLLTLAREGWSGVGALYARFVRWRFGLRWYLLVAAGIPLLGWLVSRLVGVLPLKNAVTPAQILSLLFYLLVTGPLLEELGWRGYALPRLLGRFSPFASSLVLGLIWGVWHLPSFFLSETVQSGLSMPYFLLFCLSTSVLITWIYRHTGGSVLIAVLFHYMVNFDATFVGVPLPAMAMIMSIAAILVLVWDKEFGWFAKPQPWSAGQQSRILSSVQ